MTHGKNTAMPKPSIRILHFIQVLTSADMVSKEDVKEKLAIQNSAFYKHLSEIRMLFPIEFVGSMGGNAYYSIDKKAVAKFFNIS